MYFIFRYLIGFSIMALGVGLMILSCFMKDWDTGTRLGVFGLGLGALGFGGAYLQG